jgi:hypothetical protein
MDDSTLRDVMEAMFQVRDAAAISTTRLEPKIDAVDTKLGAEIGALRSEMHRRFDRVDARLTALEAPRRRPKNRE